MANQVGPMNDQPLVYHRTSLSALTLGAYVDPDLETCESYLVRWTSMMNKEVGFFGMSFRAGGNVPQLFGLTIDLVAGSR